MMVNFNFFFDGNQIVYIVFKMFDKMIDVDTNQIFEK